MISKCQVCLRFFQEASFALQNQCTLAFKRPFSDSSYLITGDPISCISDGAIPGHVLNTYCWVTYTFTLPNAPHPGMNRLVQYLMDTLHMHNTYSFGYFFSEVLNFMNVVGNIFFLDMFLGGAFLTYGSDVIKFSNMNQEQRTDPMIEVFPRLTKCTFHKFGASGSIQKHDALCVLATNILNEKIFIFLWFWFIILAVVSGLAMVYSAAVIILPSTRETILKRRFRFGTPNGNMSLRVFGEVLDELSRRLHLGSNAPSAPSTLEMAPIYPDIDKFSKETET
ncbi:Innexin [Operophtera brumata]|uniref:Innexin n=1 Tax=Operophtera brumata TaxID=104452 RepID=A0A0L7KPW2_OPEBR|nr:Innexin [Operophtera brumata]